jgi:CRP-like cAMP-binding protein/phosphoribosyl 1,2-cyclic phosphodiesterase
MGEERETYTTLPRGGYLAETSEGHIQIGIPPETIKDTMLMDCGVPQYFVAPTIMFDWGKGISVAEIEFPMFYNYFIKKRKTLIICTVDQHKALCDVLQESMFGPKELDIITDFSGVPKSSIPDIGKEMNYFSGNMKVDDLIGFIIFKKGSVKIGNVTIRKSESDTFEIIDGENRNIIPANVEYKTHFLLGERLNEPYIPPLFGVTCLGPSHGFDPKENTSGFIVWLNHQGIMVDPPVNSTEWLEDSNVNPKLIDSIILTHCHSDHDAGTFQKILEETRITIYSTETVLMSFLRKYSAISGESVSQLMNLFHFHPVRIGRPVFIHGGKFIFSYSLHSIPTISFRMEYQDQSFVYSSDHMNDPALHKLIFDEGIISKERYDELSSFPWNSKVIYHESGIPPLHTPIKYLNSLSEEIKKRIVVYHIAKKDFLEDTLLTLAKFGIENTLYFDMKSPDNETAYQILGLLKRIDMFDEMSAAKGQEFLGIVEKESFSKGDVIIRKGTSGDKFYIIFRGNVSVDSGDDLASRKIYGTYDYFGEVALVTDQNRVADVIAETDVIAYTIERDKFINFFVGTEFEKMLMRLAKIRTGETWNLLSNSPFFRFCTSTQKTWLESIFIPIEFKGKGILLKQGDQIDFIYIIRDGEITVEKDGNEKTVLRQGDFVGTMQDMQKGIRSEFSYVHANTISAFAMKKQDILKFSRHNPGIMMKQIYTCKK